VSNSYQQNLTLTSAWLSTQVRPTGAIQYTASAISPYFGNQAAIGMCLDAARLPQVVGWMRWYLAHLNMPDRYGLDATVYDYYIVNGVETTTTAVITEPDYDSADSYAATFLSLAWTAWQTNDPTTQAYIKTISYQLDLIGGVLIKLQQSDGLTWAKPNYQIKYTMDNCEVYRGFRDLASLFSAVGDSAKYAYYTAAADSCLKGIMSLWVNEAWSVYKDALGNLRAPSMTAWYPDATAQLFPILHGIIAPSSTLAQESYSAFCTAWPGWPTLSFSSQNSFPWCLVGCVAAAMSDTKRLATYIATVQAKYVPAFPWTWYDAEAGWFMLGNDYLVNRDLNLELDSGWETHVGEDIGGPDPYVPPTSYGFTQLPSVISDWMIFYIQGAPYTCWLAGLTRPMPPNNGSLTLGFDVATDADTFVNAQALEFDVDVVDGKQYLYPAGLQIVYETGGEVQVWNGVDWIGTGVTVGKFAANTVNHVAIENQFNFSAHTWTILSITVNGKVYGISVGEFVATLSDWAANTATIQVQQDLGAAGGSMAQGLRNTDFLWG
jgi:hypothetical protein